MKPEIEFSTSADPHWARVQEGVEILGDALVRIAKGCCVAASYEAVISAVINHAILTDSTKTAIAAVDQLATKLRDPEFMAGVKAAQALWDSTPRGNG